MLAVYNIEYFLQNGENQISAPGQFFLNTFHNDPLHLDLTHIMTIIFAINLWMTGGFCKYIAFLCI